METRLQKYMEEPIEIGDEIQLLDEMGFNPLNHKCFNCGNYLLDYYKTCRYTIKRGKIVILICLICGSRNTEKDLDYRMWHKKETILKFIQLREKGFTPYTIVSHNKLKIGMMTSFRWEKKFKKEIKNGNA